MKKIYLFLLASCLWHFSQAQLYGDYLGNGHLQGIKVSSSHNSSSDHQAVNTLNGFPNQSSLILEDASRFLYQATFGAPLNEIERTAEVGFESWMDEQFKLPATRMEPLVYRFYELEEEDDDEQIIFSFNCRLAWWHNILTAEDQLRQRMAFALSQILVTSAVPGELEESGEGVANYYDILLRNAFGNYRDILMEVSLHPVMGFYLSHYNNPKADTVNNVFPDENYAREIMQLFTIGLYELNMDGSRKLDANGAPVPTYDNNDIKEMAKVFTGLGHSEMKEQDDEAFFGIAWYEGKSTAPMKMYDQFHEKEEKKLINGVILPANQSGMKDIEDAIDLLFRHPNTAPFISRLLIQRLATSNPSPAYIERVANVFANNGKGVRGDMKAVLKAILLDKEARECGNRLENPNKAMLREPILRYSHYLRAMEIRTIEGEDVWTELFYNVSARFWRSTSQMAFYSPSVFNFFLPDYQPNGLISDVGLVAPEFQINNSTTSIGYVNEVDYWTFRKSLMPYYDPQEFLAEGEPLPMEFEYDSDYPAMINLEAFLPLASKEEDLLKRLDLLLTHGQLSTESSSIILHAIKQLDEAEDKVYMALYLVMISPDYVIFN